MAEKAEYPKWVYQGAHGIIVESKEEHMALEGAWHELPCYDTSDAEEPAPAEESTPRGRGRPKRV